MDEEEIEEAMIAIKNYLNNFKKNWKFTRRLKIDVNDNKIDNKIYLSRYDENKKEFKVDKNNWLYIVLI